LLPSSVGSAWLLHLLLSARSIIVTIEGDSGVIQEPKFFACIFGEKQVADIVGPTSKRPNYQCVEVTVVSSANEMRNYLMQRPIKNNEPVSTVQIYCGLISGVNFLCN
jgi:hypothetical protein